MQKIDATIQVYVTWNYEHDRWEIDPACYDGPLDWVSPPYIYDPDTDLPVPERQMQLALPTAADTPISIGDLALMLGRGVTEQANANRAVMPANGRRPVSRGLIEVIDNLLESAAADHHVDIPHGLLATIRARLLPIFASVDQNAEERATYAARVSKAGR